MLALVAFEEFHGIIIDLSKNIKLFALIFLIANIMIDSFGRTVPVRPFIAVGDDSVLIDLRNQIEENQ